MEEEYEECDKIHYGLKTVMTLIGVEESSNKALQVELTANTAATTTVQAGSVAVEQEPTASVASAFPATSIKLSSILKTKRK